MKEDKPTHWTRKGCGNGMTIREQTQQLERQTLAPWAAFSQETRGRQRPEEEGVDTASCDYVAGMTDHYAVACYQELFIPKAWNLGLGH